LRICSGSGCLRAVNDEVRFCDDCKPVATVVHDADIKEHGLGYDEALDRLRKGSRWRKIRDLAIRACPLCARCELAVSVEVDHIVPAREAIAQAQASGAHPLDKYAGYFLLSNLQGLCRKCHYTKTLEDKTHTGEWDSVVEKHQRTTRRTWTF
jgi:5-methylcytosine-specific restriction endonuclease McrA